MKRSYYLFAVAVLLARACAGQTLAQSGPRDAAPRGAAVAPAPAPAANPDSVYVNPEVRPQFVGGDKAFAAYLAKGLRYPQQALQRHITGKVYIGFILSAQGRVQDAHVVRGPGNGLDQEALRLVWLMPLWEPARVNGQPVRVACTIPINFN